MIEKTIKKPDPIRNVISNGASKKSLCYLAIVLVIALLVFAGLLYYLSLVSRPGPTTEEVSEVLQRQRIIEQQLEELDKLRGEVKPLTEKEIQSQLKELNKARQSFQPLTEEETQKQLEELNKLR